MLTKRSPEYHNLLAVHRDRRRDIGVRVRVPADVERELEQLGKEIRENKTSRTHDGTLDNAPFEQRNVKGARGAWAAAHYLGVPFDWNLYRGKDPGYDLVVAGRTVDVKTLQEFLIFKTVAAFTAEFALLVNHAKHTADLMVVGWCTPFTFREESFMLDLGYGPYPSLTAKHLFTVREMKTWRAEMPTADEIFK